MKRTLSFAFAVLTAVALFVGCTKTPINGHKSELELSNVSANETKAVIDGTIFPKDGHIGLFLFKDESAVSPYGDTSCSNVEYSYNGDNGKWTAKPPITVGGEPGYLYGYYPYNSSVTDIKSIPVASSLDGNDVMYATKQTVTDETASQTAIKMNHALACVSITVVNNGYTLGKAELSSIKFSGAETSVNGLLDATSGIISGTTKADVTLEVPSGKQAITAEGTVYECLLVPSEEESLVQTLDLTLNIDGDDKTTTLSGDTGVTIAQNTKSNVTIALSNTGISVQTVSIEDWNVVEVGGHKFTLEFSDDTGITDNLIVQCKPDGNSVKVEVGSKTTIPLVIRIGDNTRIAPVEKGNISTFTIPDITSDITATLAYAKTFKVTGILVPDVNPEAGYFNNIHFDGLRDVTEGRSATVKVVGSAPGYNLKKMVCDGKTVTGNTILLENVSKDLEVSAHFEFYDYPLPGVFTVAVDDKNNQRKVRFARGNMWYQEGVLHNESEQYHSSSAGWSTRWQMSHFMWCTSLTKSVEQEYKESGTTTSDNFFTNTGNDHLSPNPDLIVNGQKGLWRVLSGGKGGEWDYLLNIRATTYGSGVLSTGNHRYAAVKAVGKAGLLIFPDEFSAWPSGAGDEPQTFNTYSDSWNDRNYTVEQFTVLQNNGCVFLPVTGYRTAPEQFVMQVDDGFYWSSTPSVSPNQTANYINFGIFHVYSASSLGRWHACAVRLVSDCQ